MNPRNHWTREYLALALVLAGLVLLFGFLTDRFLSPATFGTIANRIPTLALVATGMTLILVSGGIDLSVGSILALSGAVFGVALADWGWPLLPSACLGVAAGFAAGGVNGSIVARLNVPPFIVTLGMLEMARGLAYLVTRSQTKYLGASVEPLAAPVAGTGLSASFLMAVAAVIMAHVLLTRTLFGRYIVAIGTNESATHLAGIDPRPLKMAVYALSGALAALGALCHAGRLGASDPNAGAGLELAAIAAAVIGGTSLMGGRGSVIRTFFGVLIIATLEAGLNQAGASEPVKRLVTGLVIIIAVVADAWRQRQAGKPFALFHRLFSRRAS